MTQNVQDTSVPAVPPVPPAAGVGFATQRMPSVAPPDSALPGLHKARGRASEEVPELNQTVLDEAGLRQLFADVSERSLLEATVRSTPLARPRRVRQLARLLTRLVERRVFGAQLRYEQGGLIWLDTLIATTGGVRLVRLEATP